MIKDYNENKEKYLKINENKHLNDKKESIKSLIVKSTLGFLIGVLSGLFSSGGGIVAIFLYEKILKLDEKESRANAIFTILPLVITSFLIYKKEKFKLDVNLAILCSIGGIIGSFIGTHLLKKINSRILKIIFVIFLIYTSWRMIKNV